MATDAPLTPEALARELDEKLENEVGVLVSLLAELAGDEASFERFDRVAEAAVRDDRVRSLASAYDRLADDPRTAQLSKRLRSGFFLKAARFFADVVEDAAAALPYAKKAARFDPTDQEAFETLEILLIDVQDAEELEMLYSSTAARQSDPIEELRVLRRGVRLLEVMPNAEEQVAALTSLVIARDPADAAAFESLEKLYASTGRSSELARLLEERLAGDVQREDADRLRLRLAKLCSDSLGDLEKGAAHVETLLLRDSPSGEALEVAAALLERLLGGDSATSPPESTARLAELLSTAYGRSGRIGSEISALELELRVAKAPRLGEVQRRLVELRAKELDDPEGALELLEPMIDADPGNEDLRRRYLEVIGKLDRGAQAVRVLTRSVRAAKEADVRASIGYDLASLQLRAGDVDRGRRELFRVVKTGSKSARVLDAAHRLFELDEKAADPALLLPALSAIVELETESTGRQRAAEKLLSMIEPDDAAAALAWRVLVDSPRAAEALDRLEALYERSGDHQALTGVLEDKARRATDESEARRLAFRAAELRARARHGRDAEIQVWQELLKQHGADRAAHEKLLPLLEEAGRWEDLCRTLEAEVDLAPPDEKAPLLLRLGQMRESQLTDRKSALSAFRRCLKADPENATARGAVEELLADSDLRAAAADALEPVYRGLGDDDGLTRVLETRAELGDDVDARLGALASAMEIAERRGSDRGFGIASRALELAREHRPEAASSWVERAGQLAAKIGGPAARENLVLVCHQALDAEPSSLELLRRIDAVLGEDESATERLGRYRTGVDTAADAPTRHALLEAVARIQRDDLGDLDGAAETLEKVLAENPLDATAHGGLAEVAARRGDTDTLFRHLDYAVSVLEGPDRHPVLVRRAKALVEADRREEAARVLNELLDESDVDESTSDRVAQLAYDEDEPEIYRRALELLASSDDPSWRRSALERLGDFQFEHLGDQRAAIQSWKPAALEYKEDADAETHAQGLYERVLDATPDDAEAAEHLLELYAQSGDWVKMPAIYSVLLRTAESGEKAAAAVLELETAAVAAGAVDELAAMIDEATWSPACQSSGIKHALLQAKARALTSDDGRQVEASSALRGLIETYEKDEDVASFESFIEANPDAKRRHGDRRWLFKWRAGRAPEPVPILTEWAKVEEEWGDVETAIEAYERIVEAGPSVGALEELARLQLDGGKLEAALASLVTLRQQIADERGPAVDLRIARVLLELGRPREAVEAVARLLSTSPPDAGALDVAREALKDATACERAAELLERAAGATDDPSVSAELLELLMESDPTSAIAARRPAWFTKLAELRSDEEALTLLLRGAVDHPSAASVWDAAEQRARALKRPDPVAEAYRRVLFTDPLEPGLAEAIARRVVELHTEWYSDSALLVEALGRVVEVAPEARWAFDRVKLALSSSARWDDLFRLYEHALGAASDPAYRAELLDEAALAAKDFAQEPDRAVRYLEELRRLRPEDARVEASLLRLYERLDRKEELVELLVRRLDEVVGVELRELRHRIATLWLDLGREDQAAPFIDRLLEADPAIAPVRELLERVLESEAPPPADPRARGSANARAMALQRLRRYYADLERPSDSIRLVLVELRDATGSERRAKLVGELVRLRLEAAGGTPDDAASTGAKDAFGRALPALMADVWSDPSLARVAVEAVVVRARHTWEREPASLDAMAAVWWSVHALAQLLIENDKPKQAVLLLSRSAALPFDSVRRRRLLRDAALVACDELDDPERATSILRELFDEDAGDEVALSVLDRFAALLEAANAEEELASLWEEQGRLRAEGGDRDRARELWARAASLWEGMDQWERAIDAHRQSAAFGHTPSLEVLAKTYTERDEWAAAAEVLEWLYAADPSGERGLRLAEAYLRLGRRDPAVARLEDAVAADPEAGTARGRLADLYRQGEIWQPLVALLTAEAERASGTSEKLALLREAAEVCESRLEDSASAVPLLEAALALDPEDAALRLRVGSALSAAGRHDEAVAVLEAQIERYGHRFPKERARVHRELAEVNRRRGNQPAALEQLQSASEVDPGNSGILADLAQLAVAEDRLDLAESTYRALLLALNQSPEGGGSELGRAEVYIELSEIASRRGDEDRAADLVESAFDTALESPDQATRLEGALRERGRYTLLARSVERRLKSATISSATANALVDLTGLYEEHLDGPDDVAKLLTSHATMLRETLEEMGSADVAAWGAVVEAYRAVGARDPLVGALETTLGLVKDAADRTRLRLQLATTLLEDPDRVDDAVTILQNVLAEAPTQRRAGELLERVFEEQGRTGELVWILKDQVSRLATEGDAAGHAVASLRLGAALERADREEEAAQAYESAVDRCPSDAATLRALADGLDRVGSSRLADGLERLLEVAEAGSRSGIAARVVALRDGQGDAEGALQALEVGFALDPTAAELRERLVERYTERGEHEAVVRVLDRALAEEPGSEGILVRLVESHLRAGTPQKALDLSSVALESGTTAPLLAARSRVYETMHNDAQAVADCERAYELDPGRREELLALLDRAHERANADVASTYALRIVDLLEVRGDGEEARRRLGELLERDPDHVEALRRAASFAASDGDWERANDAYARLFPRLEGDREELVRVALALADGCERSGRPLDARGALEQALAVRPSPDLRRRLASIYEAIGEHRKLADLLVVEADEEQDPAEKAARKLRAGELFLRDSDQVTKALELIGAARAELPESADVELSWARALGAANQTDEALEVLRAAAAAGKGKRSPTLARVHFAIAEAHLAVDEIFEAFDELAKAFGMDPKFDEAALLLGLVALDLDDERTALRALRAVSSMKTRENASSAGAPAEAKATAFYHQARIAKHQGDDRKARMIAMKAVRADPDHEMAQALVEELRQ